MNHCINSRLSPLIVNSGQFQWNQALATSETENNHGFQHPGSCGSSADNMFIGIPCVSDPRENYICELVEHTIILITFWTREDDSVATSIPDNDFWCSRIHWFDSNMDILIKTNVVFIDKFAIVFSYTAKKRVKYNAKLVTRDRTVCWNPYVRDRKTGISWRHLFSKYLLAMHEFVYFIFFFIDNFVLPGICMTYSFWQTKFEVFWRWNYLNVYNM